MPDEPQERSVSSAIDVRPWNRIHVRISLLYGAVVLVVLLVLGGAFYERTVGTEMDRLQRQALGVARTVGQIMEGLQPPIDGQTPTPIQKLVSSRAGLRAVFAVSLEAGGRNTRWLFHHGLPSDRMMEPAPGPDTIEDLARISDGAFAEGKPRNIHGGLVLSAYAPVPGQSNSFVGVDMEASGLAEIRRRTLTLLVGGLALAMALLMGITLVVGRQVRRPFEELLEATERLSQGDLETRVDETRIDELGILARRFNQMAHDLAERQFMQETFGRYLSEDIAQSLRADPRAVRLGGELREVTIMFTDLRGYSTISERLTPTEVVELVNAYMTVMHDVVVEHGGSVIEYQGDGVLATFGAPVRQEDHAEKGVRCALAIEGRLTELKRSLANGALGERLAEVGVTHLESRVGLHTGTVVAGNLGSPAHMKYGVIGDAVNVSARLETLNKELGTRILISDKTHQRLSPELRELATVQGVRQVKGREQPVGVFSIEA